MKKTFKIASILFAGIVLALPITANAKATNHQKQTTSHQTQTTSFQYYKLTHSVKAQDQTVKIKDKKQILTNQVIKSKLIKKGTGVYARKLSQNNWLIYNNQYPINKNNVWVINNAKDSLFKKTTAPQAKQDFTAEAGQYQTASSNVQPNENNYTDLYAPITLKPISFSDQFTMNPGEKVSVKSDDANNRYIIQAPNGQLYPLEKNNSFQFSNTNVMVQGNNIISTFAPTDSQAVVPQDFKPISGQIWVELNSDGSAKQYYFYSNSNSKNTGWVKATVQKENGKRTLVPVTNQK